jgi:ribosome-associated protein
MKDATAMIEIQGITIGPEEIHESFMRCSGPGGQNVNKVNSGVQLRFSVRASASLPEDVRRRLIRIAGRRLNRDGEIVLTVQKHRSQLGNRQEALLRLEEMVRAALKPPKPRKPTRVPRRSRRRRLDDKRHRGRVKQLRRDPSQKAGSASDGPAVSACGASRR